MELFVSDIDTSEFSHTDGKGKLNAHDMCAATTFRTEFLLCRVPERTFLPSQNENSPSVEHIVF